jgi:hypothetical protein
MQAALGHGEGRASDQDQRKRGQGRQKHPAPWAMAASREAALDALDLGRLQAAHLAGLVQEGQALLQAFRCCFGPGGLFIG